MSEVVVRRGRSRAEAAALVAEFETSYPELELSTNLAEPRTQCAPLPLAAPTGSISAANRPGHAWPPSFRLKESWRRLKIPVRNYLADILPGLANAPNPTSVA